MWLLHVLDLHVHVVYMYMYMYISCDIINVMYFANTNDICMFYLLHNYCISL